MLQVSVTVHAVQEEDSVAKENEQPFENEDNFKARISSSYCGNTDTRTLMPFCSKMMYPDDMPDGKKKGNGGNNIIIF